MKSRVAVTISLLALGLWLALSQVGTAEAQITFRAGSSAEAPAAGTITFRAAAQAAAPASSTIAFRAAASAAVDSGVLTLTIPKPTGTAQGDVMITSIAIRPSTATITLLAGWTLVRRTDNALATASSLAVYQKVAGASEPASYAWTLGGAPTGAAGGIQTFSGVDTTTPIDVENGAATTAATTTPATPSITTRVANTMLVTSHSIPNRDLWASPPTWGGTESFQVRAGVAPIMLQGSRALQAAIGATGTKTATDLGPDAADNGNAHILALRPGVASLTINKPTGTVQNDVMVATIGISANTPTITAPAGWTLSVGQFNNTATNANSLAVYWKVAGASEPANYSWTFSAPTGSAGGILTFSGVDTASPVNAEAGQTTASSLTHATPAITPTAANVMLVASFTFSSSATWTEGSGMSEAVDVLSQAAGANGQSTAVYYAAQGPTGSTSKTATASGNADVGNTHLLALRPATQPSLTINKPTGTAQNDVMVASIGFRPNTLAITPPSGWTLVRRIDNANSPANSLAVYRLVAGASEPASYTWTSSPSGILGGGILSFSGVDTTTPIDVENGQNTLSGLTHDAPSVTTTVSNTMLVTSHTYASAGTWTPPTGMTEAVDVAASTQSIEVNYVLQAAVGATGIKTATAANDADIGNAHILALRPPQCGAVADATYVAANARTGQATVYWSSANPVLILRKTVAWAGEKPSNAQEYNVNDAIGAATVVFKGTGGETSFNQATSNGTTYRYKVFAKTGSGATACYSAGTEVTALHPSAAGSPQAWSYALVGGSMLKPGIAGSSALYASGNGGRVLSLSTGAGIQNWTPVATNAAVQGWLSWVPLSSYRYRQRMTITAGSAAVPNGYSASVTFNHASLVSAGKSQADGDDIRVFYKNGATWVELDRVLDRLSSWNNAATTIWFKTQAAIGASSSDSNYYLHYGNPSAANPPANKSNVYDFFDDFSGTLAAWTQQGGGTWTISGGILSVTGVIDGDVLYVTGKNYTDVVIDADFRSPTDVSDDLVAPVWRLNSATGARYDFSHKSGGASSTRVRMWSPDWWTHPCCDTADATAISAVVWYHAKVTVSGSTFTATREGEIGRASCRERV